MTTSYYRRRYPILGFVVGLFVWAVIAAMLWRVAIAAAAVGLLIVCFRYVRTDMRRRTYRARHTATHRFHEYRGRGRSRS